MEDVEARRPSLDADGLGERGSVAPRVEGVLGVVDDQHRRRIQPERPDHPEPAVALGLRDRPAVPAATLAVAVLLVLLVDHPAHRHPVARPSSSRSNTLQKRVCHRATKRSWACFSSGVSGGTGGTVTMCAPTLVSTRMDR